VPEAHVNGVRLYYEERGSGTPVLGLHGAGSSAVFWEDAADTWSELGRAIVYDRRGSNRSERPTPYELTSVQEQADDALALLEALHAVPAILVGRSYGATVALDLALRNPEAVIGLALLEAGPLGLSPEYDAWFEELAEKLGHVHADEVGRIVLDEVFGAWDELPEIWRAVFTANGPALLAEVRGREETDNARLAEIGVPTMVVTAEGSPEPIRLGSEALARAIPGAEHVLVRGGHAIDPAGPDILAFLARLVAATTSTGSRS
jgi:esterase